MQFILLILEVFHFEISSKYDNNSQLENIKFIFVTAEIFHFEISGKDNNDLQFENI